jgi:homopolymeric O-antigen transport system ATP-binding protein
MHSTVISVDGLGKRYFIGARRQRYSTLRESLARAVKSPFRRVRDLASGHSSGAADLQKELWALRDLSLTVGAGEAVGIIGPNGAGKTTLLKILSRITEPTEGVVRLKGRVGSLLEVGTGFHPELTGRENIYLNGAILGMKRADLARKFDRIVDFAEVEEFLDTPVKFYSSGMYVRLAFAVAAHLEPEILVVDEVLAVGDAAFQKKCLGKMGDVAKGGRTVLFVSHSMVAVQSLCDRAICLRAGRLADEGNPEEVISNYLKTQTEDALRCREWDRPDGSAGDQGLYWRRIQVKPAQGGPDAPITTGDPIDLEFEYWNQKAGAAIGMNYHLFNEQGILLFEGGTTDPIGPADNPFPAGLYRAACHIPAHLLNQGTHYVSVQLVKNNRFAHRMEHVLSFAVLDTRRRSGSWHGKAAGAVRPMLDWTIQVDEDESLSTTTPASQPR